MSYTVKEIIGDFPRNLLSIHELLNEVYHHSIDFQLLENLITPKLYPDILCMGSYYQNQLVGFAAFIPMLMHYSGHEVTLYQRCLVGIRKPHRRLGLFTKMTNDASRLLYEKEAAGIIGFPVYQAYEISIKDQGYKDMGGFLHTLVPFSKLTGNKIIKQLPQTTWDENSLIAKEPELMNWKMHTNKQIQILFKNKSGSQIWGKKKIISKFGIHIPTIIPGGLMLFENQKINSFLLQYFAMQNAPLISMIYPERSLLAEIFRYAKRSKSGRIIYLPLHLPFQSIRYLNILPGVMDTF